MKFNVEDETGRRLCAPISCRAGFGYTIKSGVDLDQVKMFCVVPQSIGGANIGRIPVFNEAWVGPTGSSCENSALHTIYARIYSKPAQVGIGRIHPTIRLPKLCCALNFGGWTNQTK